MALTEIILNSTTFYDNYTYTYASVSNQGSPTKTGSNTWNASRTITSTNKPFRYSDTKAYFLRKPGALGFTTYATQSNVFNTYKENKEYAWTVEVPIAAQANTCSSVSVSYSGPPYLQATWNIPCYSGIVSYTTPYAGKYEFMCWGANGGNGYSTYFNNDRESGSGGYKLATAAQISAGKCYSYGGKGGYTYGVLSSLASNVPFFVCVGGAGNNSSTTYYPTTSKGQLVAGGYNGGGSGQEWNNGGNGYTHNAGGGGGATHIATTTGLLQNLTKAQTLMVAGAGGGAGGHEQRLAGGNAGGTEGSAGDHYGSSFEIALGGTQIAGGGWYKEGTTTDTDYTAYGERGGYGKGGSHKVNTGGGGGGGGAGYYGGASGYWKAGGGGSSYINGHSSCTRQNSTYVFESGSAKMIAGANVASQAPNPSGNNNGYARITFTYIP